MVVDLQFQEATTMISSNPTLISCYVLLRFIDDAITMVRALQHVTVRLMTKLEDRKCTFPYSVSSPLVSF